MQDEHDESLGFLLNDLSRMMRKRFDSRARELDLTRAQWRVLARLRRRQGVNQSTLAELLELEPITLARHIDRLEEKGWVERRSDPNDRRAWLLYLDDSVKPVLEEMKDISQWNLGAATRGFSGEETARLIEDLYRIKANLIAEEQEELEELRAVSEAEAETLRRAAQGGSHG